MNNATLTFNEASPEVAALGIAIILVFALIGLATAILMAVVYCKICSKTGYSWALGLLMFVPIANIVLLLILAFSEWPIQKELQAFQRR